MLSWLIRWATTLLWLSLAALVADTIWLGFYDSTDEWSSLAVFPIGPLAVGVIAYLRRGFGNALAVVLLMLALEVVMIVPAVFIVLIVGYALAD